MKYHDQLQCSCSALRGQSQILLASMIIPYALIFKHLSECVSLNWLYEWYKKYAVSSVFMSDIFLIVYQLNN